MFNSAIDFLWFIFLDAIELGLEHRIRLGSDVVEFFDFRVGNQGICAIGCIRSRHALLGLRDSTDTLEAHGQKVQIKGDVLTSIAKIGFKATNGVFISA